VKIIQEIQKRKLSRRGFVAGVGASAGAAVMAGCGGGGNYTVPPTPPPVTYADTDILNFALNLEYLEAEFYLRAATGSGLSTADAGSGAGAVTGGAMVPGLTGIYTSFQDLLNEIAQDELNHVRFLQQAISEFGGTPVSRPAIDFTAGFGAFATASASSSTPIPTTFNPFNSFAEFLLGAFAFEDVGVTAYTGAAPLISATSQGQTILNAAAGIQATECYHAATIRNSIILADIIAGNTDATGTAATGVTTYTALANEVSAIRSLLGGGDEVSLSQTSPIASSTTTGESYARNFSQVLHIVYAKSGGAGVTSGGFFPNGVNGTIAATTA
jgi:hypothetical protein